MEPVLLDDPPDDSLGPAMLAISPMARRFVLAVLTFPTGKDWQFAKAAGYSAKSYGSLRVTAHRLLHDEKIIAAMHEEAGKRLRSSAILGISVMASIARTDGHKDQLKAAEALANRVGFGVEQRITVTKTDQTGANMVQRIKELAAALGVDATVLLGANVPEPMKVIKHEPVANSGTIGTTPTMAGGIPSAESRTDQPETEGIFKDGGS